MLKYDYTENELVLCRAFTSDFQARMAQAALNQEGIETTIDGEIFAGLYPGMGFASVRIMVRRRDLDRANSIVDSLDFSEPTTDFDTNS